MLSWGNGYAYIQRDKNLFPESLIILEPRDTTPVVIEGEIFYKYKEVMLKQDDVLHFKLYSFDGILGVSPIIHNANAFGAKIKLEKYTAKVLGSKPPGVITFTQDLTDIQVNENREAWKRMTQGDDLGGTPVLSGGAKYQPFMVPPNEGQMIEATELSDEKIAGIYRVPPTLLQNYRRATFSNAEQQDLVYLKYGLTPILRVIEQECDYKLFTEAEKMSDNPPYTKFNIKGMLRGDIKTQAEWYKMLRTYGLANANTILEMEDMAPLEGDLGEMVLVQGAMIPLNQLEAFYQGKSNDQGDLRQLGFDLDRLKEAIERQEILNSHEEGLHK
jgi:HK97 family phage portal protein